MVRDAKNQKCFFGMARWRVVAFFAAGGRGADLGADRRAHPLDAIRGGAYSSGPQTIMSSCGI